MHKCILILSILLTCKYVLLGGQRIDGGPYYRPLAPARPHAPPPPPGLFTSLSNSFNSFVSNIFG